MYKIREAKVEDYSSFLQLYQESKKERGETNAPAVHKEAFEEIVKSPFYELYVVENNRELQAFTLFYRKKISYLLEQEREVLYIEAMFVKPSEEKKGLKLYLYEKIERYAKRNGIGQIETFLPIVEQEKIAHYEERFKLKAEDALLVSRLESPGR